MRPLVTRPPYGSRDTTVSQSKLPEGSPGGKGVSLDPDIPGQKTFVKPLDDTRQTGKDDESIYRVDNPDDLTKEQTRPDVNMDNADKHDGIGYLPGKGPWDSTSRPKWPYRDRAKHPHNASSEFVLNSYLLTRAHDLTLPAEGSNLRVATKLGDIEQGLNPQVTERAQTCSVTLKRADVANRRWLFSVDCGNGPKVVRIKAEKSRSSQMAKFDLHITCSCPAWRWLGPEHHSKREDYLDGTPRGTASVPRIKDPEGINRVCKHVKAVLGTVKNWQISKKKNIKSEK